MTVKEKLLKIQEFSGLTQSQMASRLGVTFAALNRWLNEKSQPRALAQEKIDALLREFTGEKEIPVDQLGAKKNAVFDKQKQFPSVIGEILNNHDIRDQLILLLTYHSNRIEGSTLTENETAAILFQNTALPDKTLTEQLEAKNHQTALDYLLRQVSQKKPITEDFILESHKILMNGVRDDAGFYRRHSVRIVGANIATANFLKVPELMADLVGRINSKNNIIDLVAEIHAKFEQIHPFADGNGRIGRLLLQAMLLLNNFAPAIIRQENRRFYMMYLNKAQAKNDLSLLEDFICDAILDGYVVLQRMD